MTKVYKFLKSIQAKKNRLEDVCLASVFANFAKLQLFL